MAKPNLTPPALSAEEIERFWIYVDRTPGQGPKGECWEWQAGRNKYGYGNFKPNHRGRTYRSSRLAFYLTNLRWPKHHTCHRCDNPPCVRPNHLFDGTNKDNIEDARDKGRLCVGSRSHAVKLAETDIIAIREAYKTTNVTQKTLAIHYGVAYSLISRIVRGQSWSHVKQPLV